MKKTKQVADYRELLRAGRWFRGLPAGLQEGLLGLGRLRRVRAHEVVIAEGSPCTEIVAVLEGRLRVSRRDPRAGRGLVLTMVEPPNWCGEIGLFDDGVRSHELTAEVETLLLHVPADALLALLEREPVYWRDLARLVTAKLRLALVGMEEAAGSSVTERVAHRLVMIAEGYGEWTDRSYPFVKVSQETLATLVGSSRQSVNRALRSLEGVGLIKLAYAGVELVDMERLRNGYGAELGELAKPTPPRAEA